MRVGLFRVVDPQGRPTRAGAVDGAVAGAVTGALLGLSAADSDGLGSGGGGGGGTFGGAGDGMRAEQTRRALLLARARERAHQERLALLLASFQQNAGGAAGGGHGLATVGALSAASRPGPAFIWREYVDLGGGGSGGGGGWYDEPESSQGMGRASEATIRSLPTRTVPAPAQGDCGGDHISGGDGTTGPGCGGADPPVQCPICLEKQGPGDIVKALPCLHAFHASCVDKWLRRSARCPLCNNAVDTG